MKRYILLALLLLVLPLSALRAGTRDDVAHLKTRVDGLSRQVSNLEAQVSSLKKTLEKLSEQLRAVARSSQTADLTADFNQMKGKLEVLASDLAQLKNEPRFTSKASVPVKPAAPVFFSLDEKSEPAVGVALLPTGNPPAASVPKGLYKQAYNDYLQGKYDLAVSEFKQFEKAYPDDRKSGNCRYWIGECYYIQKRYSEAVDAFKDVTDHYPKNPKILAARLKLGMAHLAMNDAAQGVAILTALIHDAPRSNEALIAEAQLRKLLSPR